MEIKRINTTSGPNYWSIKKPRLVVMKLDIGELEYQPTDTIEGFYERIKKALPSLYGHQCSVGEPGGFFVRVKRGTWMGHVIEHIALELQTLAGLEAGFGRTRGAGRKGQYFVVFEYTDEESGRLAARKAVSAAQNLIDGIATDIDDYVSEIREAASRSHPGPSTASLLRGAASGNIPAIKLEKSSTYQLGYGCFQKKIAATIASTTGNMAVEMASDKQECKRLFKNLSIPVAEGEVVSSQKELRKAVERVSFPLVMKPLKGNQGRGVTTNIQTLEAAVKAFKTAAEISDQAIVERFIKGNDYRLLTVNYELVAASLRTSAHVVGDGKLTIKELIKKENQNPLRGEGHSKSLTKIPIGPSIRVILRKKGYSIRTVLPKNEILYLNHAANLSKGGTAKDVTEGVHPEVAAMAGRVSKIVGLDICGIDIVAPSLKKPLDETGGVVLEVNAAPGFRMHLKPSEGKARNVAVPVLDMLFPGNADCRIPITAVTGTNGKTTTTRLISHIFQAENRSVGTTTTDGIYVNGRLMMTGDCGGPRSAEFVLKDPTVDTAVLECARGGILRSGLGFDRCDVGVVTNVTSDHLGLSGIDSLEKMSKVKSVVPESVRPGGYVVLNADDDLVYAMRNNVDCDIVLFSMDSNSKRIKEHRAAGNICVTCQAGHIVIWDGNATHIVEKVENVPLTFNGRAGFMVENVLAATGSVYCQGVKPDVIRGVLQNFKPSPEQTPGRMNIFSFGRFDVMVDYAHNTAGLKAVKNYLGTSTYTHKTGIVAAIGDRRRVDNIEAGRLSAKIFDNIIIREDADLRGAEPGETTQVIREGIAKSECNPPVTAIADEKEALLFAINNAVPGSVVMICTEQVNEVLKTVKQHQAVHKKSLPAAAVYSL